MSKPKGSKRAQKNLQSAENNSKEVAKESSGGKKSPHPPRKKKSRRNKCKKPHDQFFDKQTSREAIMELALQSIYSVGKGKQYSYDFKLKAVRAANDYGIKPVARRVKIARNTLRSWVRRFKEDRSNGLSDRRKGPNHIPHKTSLEIEKRVLEIRRQAPCFGPIRMKFFFDIDCSIGAIARILRQHKLTKRKRQKIRKRNDLRAIKADRYKSFEFLQMDVKYLTDIPFYVKQLKPLALPRFQYTVRDTKSGILFLGYSQELSELNARTMVDYVVSHFKKAGVEAENITVQTDNGSEFSGMAHYENTATFVKHVVKKLGANHRYIRPGNKNAQADVESSHWWIETEFYDITTHKSKADFMQNTEAYRLFFNLVRPNFSREAKTPWQIAQEDWPDTDISSVLSLLPVIDLDQVEGPIFNRGQTIPKLAGSVKCQR